MPPWGWVFSLSFWLEFFSWVLVFSAAGVKKKPAVNELHGHFGYLWIFWSLLLLGVQTTHCMNFKFKNHLRTYFVSVTVDRCPTRRVDPAGWRAKTGIQSSGPFETSLAFGQTLPLSKCGSRWRRTCGQWRPGTISTKSTSSMPFLSLLYKWVKSV